ncbi:hypothetical protein DR950_41850 [Kitasatospora xanthocidica]|uniref:Uncharacterized protein n=1 Tax=Kitasatospora xanthocidica TaxID=83382 RepID=A0A372ZIY0_9ACTN|nr:hypothetical protein [Kitasatospora xanthocidica]RGD55410.1 hypothetical protein DR950_41850 [Kitasatospora xanthocidica]
MTNTTPGSPLELPDIYETRQGRALRDAYARGDMEQARRIEEHVLAEAATNGEEREVYRETLRGAILFQELMDAQEAGNDELAQSIRERMLLVCSRATILRTISAGYLQAGLREGLPQKTHDELMSMLTELGVSGELKRLAQSITVN